MRKFLNILSILTFILVLGFVGTTSFWLIYPYKVITINQQPIPVTPKIAKMGSTIYMTIDYCKFMDVTARVEKQFIDSLVYSTPTIFVNNPLGCHTNTINVLIPYGLAPETYIIKQTYTYQVNPLRTVTAVTKSEEFQITR
jgi:hypothetical protein